MTGFRAQSSFTFLVSALLVLSGCTQHQYLPGPGLSVADLNPAMAKCRLFSRERDSGHSFGAAGSARFVAAAALTDAIGSAIATGVRRSEDFDDCMIERGWLVAESGQAAIAVPALPPATQSNGDPLIHPAMAEQPLLAKPVRKAFGIRGGALDDTLAATLQVNPLRGGILVLDVERGAAGWRGGLRQEDVLLSFNEKEIFEIDDLRQELTCLNAGSLVIARVWRARKPISLQFQF